MGWLAGASLVHVQDFFLFISLFRLTFFVIFWVLSQGRVQLNFCGSSLFQPGDEVEFVVVQNQKTRKMSACSVRRIWLVIAQFSLFWHAVLLRSPEASKSVSIENFHVCNFLWNLAFLPPRASGLRNLSLLQRFSAAGEAHAQKLLRKSR